jgi:hypothetical protein
MYLQAAIQSQLHPSRFSAASVKVRSSIPLIIPVIILEELTPHQSAYLAVMTYMKARYGPFSGE